MALISPADYANYFDPSIHRPWLASALARLQELDPSTLQEGGELRKLWTAAGRGVAPNPLNPLPVPWFAQRDSATDQGMRMCFASSCAMLTEYLRPGSLPGSNGDDAYLKTLWRYGDTIDANAQLRTLAHYGIAATFVENADFDTIRRQIDLGIPVPCGFLHRGPISAPSGGGHWLIVVGYTSSTVIVHDPFGEADLVSGRTIGGSGKFLHYSIKNFGRRWMVDASRGNAFAPGNGWAIIARR